MRDNWYKSDLEKTRLDQAGVDESVVDAAVGAFILEAIAKHGHPTKVQKSFFKNQKIPSSEIAKKKPEMKSHIAEKNLICIS